MAERIVAEGHILKDAAASPLAAAAAPPGYCAAFEHPAPSVEDGPADNTRLVAARQQ
jgi:hypothetical protein